ncbi:aminodeoxychorismate synthase [Advenella kashmirensis W13003]|uniref:Aminodeoxychorismate synthase n=1 Tax=Advenella kashmirensis W13003 TaxID=1424334 RepID=V8QS62_9BURK|nr:aminodeoxychorismate synthase [Advenella kashmirensis W13003]
MKQQQSKGKWIVLVLSYELGYALEPNSRHGHARRNALDIPQDHRCWPLLTALVFNKRHVVSALSPVPVSQPLFSMVKPGVTAEHYQQTILNIKQWLARGDGYQINYTFPLQVQSQHQPLMIYRNILHQHPTRYAAYIDLEDRQILSFSPALFLEKKGPWLRTRPMKGTAPRYADPLKGAQSRQGLADSIKNRAENCMIVDLLRNDLGRIVVSGSVAVEKLFEIERYESIWTMTSTIRANVGDASLATILRALFPCGSVTGAPKIAAMRYISELEAQPRGIYCGSIGWLAPNGDMQLNVAIRTLVMNGQTGVYGVGGGIVMDSDPLEEWHECQWKSRVLSTDTRGWI